MLKVEKLKIEFVEDKKIYTAVKDLSFNIAKGEILGVVGESGCGKSITALSIIKLLPSMARIADGKVELNGKNISSLSEEEIVKIRGENVSMIFQEPMTALNPLITVGKQIEEALTIHTDMSKEKALELTLDMMSKVGLSNSEKLYKDYPHQLSGGMRQRIMIAMALINKPELLIADEPTTALDVTIQAQILELIKKLNKDFGTAVMFISHDLGIIKQICSRVVVMYAGYKVEEGTVDEVFLKPLHPYTKGLIAAIPSIALKGKELFNIKGFVPNLKNRRETGCPFADRCTEAVKNCFNERPTVYEHGKRKVMCFKATKEAKL